MKFIPKEFDVYYGEFNPDSRYDSDGVDHANEYWFEHCNENHMLSFFVSTHDEGTSAYKNRTKTATEWNSGYKNNYMNSKQTRIKNEPTKGFKFVNMTRRYRTSNVLFRIEHPLGYIFEISSENAFDIIEKCTIINGEIQEELFMNTSKYLYNTSFDLYKEQVMKMEADKAKEKNAKSMNVLDMCEFQIRESKYREYKTYELQYLGKVHVGIMYNNAFVDNKSSLIHVYYCPEEDTVHFCTDAKHKSGFIKSLDKKVLDKVPSNLGEFCNEKINARKVIRSEFKNQYNTVDIICSSSKSFKMDNVSYSIELSSAEFCADLRHVYKLGEEYYYDTGCGEYNGSWCSTADRHKETWISPITKTGEMNERQHWAKVKDYMLKDLQKTVYAVMFKVQH